jgi:hypothetical protein
MAEKWAHFDILIRDVYDYYGRLYMAGNFVSFLIHMQKNLSILSSNESLGLVSFKQEWHLGGLTFDRPSTAY